MPDNYTGKPTGLAPREPPTITCPVDKDPRTAASVNTPLQKIADYLSYIQSFAAFLGESRPNNDTLVLNGAVTDTASIVHTSHKVTTRKPIWEFDPQHSGGYKSRLYLNHQGEIEAAFNCRWDGSQWLPDTAENGYQFHKFSMRDGKIAISSFKRDGQGNWSEDDWHTCEIGAGNIAWLGKILHENANPPANAEAHNILCAKNSCKAWGLVSFNNHPEGKPILEDGFNIGSVSLDDVYNLRITFAKEFASANYAPIVTVISKGVTNSPASIGNVVQYEPNFFIVNLQIANANNSFKVTYLPHTYKLFAFTVFGRQV
jgi:hypothetical protein